MDDVDDVELQFIQNDGGRSQKNLGVSDNNRELTLMNNNVYIKPFFKPGARLVS